MEALEAEDSREAGVEEVVAALEALMEEAMAEAMEEATGKLKT